MTKTSRSTKILSISKPETWTINNLGLLKIWLTALGFGAIKTHFQMSSIAKRFILRFSTTTKTTFFLRRIRFAHAPLNGHSIFVNYDYLFKHWNFASYKVRTILADFDFNFVSAIFICSSFFFNL